MKILVRSPNWIGDQVLSYSFFAVLRDWARATFGVDKIEVHAACVPWVADLQFRDLVDQVHVIDPKHPWRSGRRVRQSGPFDLGITLPNSLGSAIFLWAAGARRRRGYNTEARGLLLHEKIHWDPNPERHRGQAYIDILGGSPSFRPSRSLAAYMAEFDPERSWARSLGSDVGRLPDPFWVVAPGATASSRQWHWERFAKLIRQAWEENGWHAVLVGGPKEVAIAEQIGAWAHERNIPLTSFVNKVPVTHLWELFRRAKLTVCNESGLAHVASLCGSPVHIVCGAADPRRTAPLGPGRVVVSTNPVQCWPCEKNQCPNQGPMYLACLKGLEWERVWGEIHDQT